MAVEQRELFSPAEPEPEALEAAPEPVPVRACTRCSWLVKMDEIDCPLCGLKQDVEATS